MHDESVLEDPMMANDLSLEGFRTVDRFPSLEPSE